MCEHNENKWEFGSFLFDIKPEANIASLFVGCCKRTGISESDSVNIQIEQECLTVTPSWDVSHPLSARLDGVSLKPDSVSELSCADPSTLQCHVTIDSIVTDIDKGTTEELATFICHASNMKRFHRTLADGFVLKCKACRKDLLSNESQTNMHCYQLPGSNWEELSDNWFCHQRSATGGEWNSRVMTALQTMELEVGQCFQNEAYVVLNATDLDQDAFVLAKSTGKLSCARCLAEIGCTYRKGQRSSSAIQLYHLCVDIIPLSLATGASFQSFISSQFHNAGRYYAWFLLNKSASESSLKFVVKNLHKVPKLLIWLLDSYSIFCDGKMKSDLHRLNPSSDSGGEKDKYQAAEDSIKMKDPDQVAAEPFKAFPVIKMIYKVFDEASAASDPRANGLDYSVVAINLPDIGCDELSEILLHSTQSLPGPIRNLGAFHVGYLKIADDLD